MTARDKLQRRIYDWAKATFGEATMVRGERVRRFLEEAIELAQAEGIPQHDVDKLAAYVYSKPPGTPEQELGGVGVTLLAYAQTAGLSAEDCEAAEFERVQKKDAAHFRARHNKKADAGVAVRTGELATDLAEHLARVSKCRHCDGSIEPELLEHGFKACEKCFDARRSPLSARQIIAMFNGEPERGEEPDGNPSD